ncbi:hypothetical protein DSO57_1009319 [Entomophthora muscae]|uniref:Uncharacterized protein n=1 Tax=Entomophthora muscae TaxID=34485 RepID=A0ACC2S8S2_9FUNG|nr:hypothetical protein DSO57_1009319 [Entomophthora muscae]
MLKIPPTLLLPTVPPAQDFDKLGLVYITVLGLANQVVPHTVSWCPLATAVNYLVRIVPIVYMTFQAQPASPVKVQPDSGMGQHVTVDSIMPGIVRSSKKARKARKPVSKLTKFSDLNQTVDQK